MRFSPLSRQVFVALTAELTHVSMGASLAFTTILLVQIQAKDSNIHADLSTISWIASTHGIAAIGAVFMPTVMQGIGRKRAFTATCLLLTCGWSLAYIAKSTAMIIAAEAFLGLGCNCVSIVNSVTISEMMAPKYRSIALNILGHGICFGMIYISVFGLFVHWKNLSLMMLCPVVLAFIMSLFWPESPPWLAYKEKFSECETAFKWLRGHESDLEELDAMREANTHKIQDKFNVKKILIRFKRRDFYIPISYMLVLLANIYGSGAVCLYIYADYILQIVLGDNSIDSIGLWMFNVTIVVGAIIALILSKFHSNKTLMNVAYLRIIFIFLCSLVHFLQKHEILSKNRWFFLICFEGQMLFTFSGFNYMCFLLSIELMPVKHRGVGGVLFTILTGSMHYLFNKILPYLMIWLDLWGTFLLFAVNGTICHYLIWKYVPETKNKTLLEIEGFYNKEKRDKDVFDVEVNEPIIKKS